MNRNTELHFSNTPQIDLRRSKFEESHSHKTSFNVGDIIPIYTDADILPGDTVQMDMAELVRMATPIYPIMDNLYLDIYWFFVPHRLVWDHWANFWGENEDPWINQTEYEIPQITAPEGGWTEGTIADYMGIPTKVNNLSVNALPFRSYAKCVNDWFRDENLKSNCHIYTDETTRQGTNEGDYVLNTELGAKPCKAAKMHDYFTSALPSPQKGPAVQIPLTGNAPFVAPSGLHLTATNDRTPVGVGNARHNYGLQTNVTWAGKVGTGQTSDIGKSVRFGGTLSAAGSLGADAFFVDLDKYTLDTNVNKDVLNGIRPVNLYAQISDDLQIKNTDINSAYADLSQVTSATVNALRTAFAIQKYYENAGLHGTRYIEYIRGVFGVTSSDARFQRAEYIGGTRVPINISQIVQTSATNDVTPQGNTAGFSCTLDQNSMFTKSFEEHGTLLCLAVVRTEHTYQQGLKKMWTRKKWTDFYNPFFANLGEQAILNENIFAQGTPVDKEAFGYQEAWAEYRYKENYVSGYMRSNASGSLDVWHFADDYTELPILGATWIDEPLENVDRTIAVTSARSHQFIGDFYFKCYYTRCMPIYSVPGLIDHV